MKEQLLIIYTNELNKKCAQFVEPGRISYILTESDYPHLFNCRDYKNCKSNQIIVHVVKSNSESENKVYPEDISSQFYFIDIFKINNINFNGAWEFIDYISQYENFVTKFYNLCLESIKEFVKNNDSKDTRMSAHYLVVYIGKDIQYKARLISYNGLSEEIPLYEIDMFKNSNYRHKIKQDADRCRYHTLLPIGGTLGQFDFNKVIDMVQISVENKTAEDFFNNMKNNEINATFVNIITTYVSVRLKTIGSYLTKKEIR